MTYDTARALTVLFGGQTSTYFTSAETWEWNGATWAQRLVSGPSTRSYAAMAYDAARGVSVLFGGLTYVDGFWVKKAETWELEVCAADFNFDTIVDFFDYLDFVDAFSSNMPSADFNADGVIDFFDYLDFVDAFSTGC